MITSIWNIIKTRQYLTFLITVILVPLTFTIFMMLAFDVWQYFFDINLFKFNNITPKTYLIIGTIIILSSFFSTYFLLIKAGVLPKITKFKTEGENRISVLSYAYLPFILLVFSVSLFFFCSLNIIDIPLKDRLSTSLSTVVVALFTIICRVIYHTHLKTEDLLRQIKEKDILSMMDRKRLKNHRIIIGLGPIGIETLKEMISLIDHKNITPILWEKPRLFLNNILIVEEETEKIPYIVGKHPQADEIGYVKHVDLKSGKNYYVMVFIGKAQSSNVQSLMSFKDARTITMCNINFNDNISILDKQIKIDLDKKHIEAIKLRNSSINSNIKQVNHSVGDIDSNIHKNKEYNSLNNNGNSSGVNGYIVPCLLNEEREILQDKLKIITNSINEVFQVREYFGFTAADMIKTKLRVAKNGRKKILFCGDLNIQNILEGLILNNTVNISTKNINTKWPETSPNLCKNILLFDTNPGPNDLPRYHSIDSYARSSKSAKYKEELIRIEDSFKKPIKIKTQLYTLFVSHKNISCPPVNLQISLPVIDEIAELYLYEVLSSWIPDIVCVVYEKPGKMLFTLKLLERWKNWQNKPQDQNPEIMVAVADPVSQKLAAEILKKEFGKSFGVYAPYTSIGREIAVIESTINSLLNDEGGQP